MSKIETELPEPTTEFPPPAPMTTTWGIDVSDDGEFVVLTEHTSHGVHVMFVQAQAVSQFITVLTKAGRDATAKRNNLKRDSAIVVPSHDLWTPGG